MSIKWAKGARVKAVIDTEIYSGTVSKVFAKGSRVEVEFDDGDVMKCHANELLPEEEMEQEETRGFNQYPVTWDEDRINFSLDVEDDFGNKAHFYGHWRRTVFEKKLTGFAIDLWCRYNGYPYSVESVLYIEDPRERPASMDSDICAMANKFLHQRLDGSASTLRDLQKRADQPILNLKTIDELDELIKKLREFRALGIRTAGTRVCSLAVTEPSKTNDQLTERVPVIGVRLNFTTSAALMGAPAKKDPAGELEPSFDDAAAKTSRKGRRAKSSSKSTKKTSSKKTPAITGSVDQLIEMLKSSTDKSEKRKIRAELRKLGHTGGAKK